MNYFAEIQEQYDDIVRMVCNQNDVIYTMSYNPHFPSMQHATCYEFEVKKGWTGMSDYPRPIIIDWDGFKGTLYDLLYILKQYFKNEHLTKNNYDWSFIMNYFTKKDLKNGDVVVCKDHDEGVYISNLSTLVLKSGKALHVPTIYNDDLTSKTMRDYDIMTVYRPKCWQHCCFDAYFYDRSELVYERKEVEEMTLEEVCKALGKEIKIVKRRSGRYPWGSGGNSLF